MTHTSTDLKTIMSTLGQSEEETSILATAETESYDKVQERVTAKRIMNIGENPLLLAIKVR